MIRHMKRAQAAMEFLMTYGWAILVVLIAIGALAYFGVLNPSRFLPESCTIGPGLACTDFKIDTNGDGTLVIRNGMGQSLTEVTVAIWDSTAGTPAYVDSSNCEAALGADADSFVDGAEVHCLFASLGITGTEGARFGENLRFSYKASGGLSHQKIGKIATKEEAP